MKFAPLGDGALVVTCVGEGADAAMEAAVKLAAAVTVARWPGVVDVVPAYASVAVFYDSVAVGEDPYARLCDAIAALAAEVSKAGPSEPVGEGRCVEIPVVYGGADGPDLGVVAEHTERGEDDVVTQHTAASYRVRAIGFAPGFPYLSGLPSDLATPRRATPRTKVPAGSVGIGGAQTGVYPLASPGGWQIIGRTPVKLFDPLRPEPALLRVGDKVRFCRTEAVDGSAAETGPAAADRVEQHDIGLRVVTAGMLTTVQDLGRVGHRAAGVPLSGVMDPRAARLANLLVGNEEDAAVLEMTLLGPELEFPHDMLIAVGGATFEGCEAWRPRVVRAGQRIRFGAAERGCRGYLAIAGGIAVPRVLGSRSTYLRAGIGGWHGRGLRPGDTVPIAPVARAVAEHWWIDPRVLPAYHEAQTVRVVLGAQAGEFSDHWADQTFKISPQSDRMGLRLAGEPLERRKGEELLSTPVAPGAVQVPPDGQPIILMADAQTMGGYPQLAHVAKVDLPLLGQTRPGDSVRFQVVPLEEAHQLWLAQEHVLAMLREGLAQKFR